MYNMSVLGGCCGVVSYVSCVRIGDWGGRFVTGESLGGTNIGVLVYALCICRGVPTYQHRYHREIIDGRASLTSKGEMVGG
jgi:hypothetical protein